MAEEKVEMKTAAAVLPLSVSVPVEEEKMKKQQARADPPLLPGVRDAILWSLLHAGVFPLALAVGTAYYMLIITIFTHPPSWLLPRPLKTTTDAEETMSLALMAGMLLCAVPQAAAAAAALMLPRHRRRLRLLLAYAALVATTAGHGMFAGLHRIFFAAEPGGVRFFSTAAIFLVGVGDFIFFLGLILRGGDE